MTFIALISIYIQGTKNFVATEVAHGGWQIEDSILPVTEDWSMPPFRQHVFHDLEPVYWAAVYFLFNFHPPNTPTSPSFETAYSQFFPVSGSRDGVWLLVGTAEHCFRSWFPAVLHSCIGPLKKWQLALRGTITEAIAETEKQNLNALSSNALASSPRAKRWYGDPPKKD